MSVNLMGHLYSPLYCHHQLAFITQKSILRSPEWTSPSSAVWSTSPVSFIIHTGKLLSGLCNISSEATLDMQVPTVIMMRLFSGSFEHAMMLLISWSCCLMQTVYGAVYNLTSISLMHGVFGTFLDCCCGSVPDFWKRQQVNLMGPHYLEYRK